MLGRVANDVFVTSRAVEYDVLLTPALVAILANLLAAVTHGTFRMIAPTGVAQDRAVLAHVLVRFNNHVPHLFSERFVADTAAVPVGVRHI